jgi:predicted 3-demethylubiquinone-9 3-methyltransferase (glyoxalase superfamily)
MSLVIVQPRGAAERALSSRIAWQAKDEMQKITPCLWFDRNAEEAVAFYTSIFKNSKVVRTLRCTDAGPWPKGTVLLVQFQLEGQDFQALNGGPQFKFNEAISLSIDCQDQREVDELWSKLTADGGQPSECSWLKDKFGVSWQIVPRVLPELLNDPDPAKATAAIRAMMQMSKIDVKKLEEAVAAAGAGK